MLNLYDESSYTIFSTATEVSYKSKNHELLNTAHKQTNLLLETFFFATSLIASLISVVGLLSNPPFTAAIFSRERV